MGFAFKMDLAGTMQNVLGVLSKQLVSVDAGFGKVTASVGSFEKAFLAVEGIKAFGRAAQWAIREVLDLGGAIVRINAQAQDLNLAAQLQLGDEGAAMLSRVADSFANTRFDDDAIKQALLPLANAGIKDEETLDAIATAAADISARFNTGEAGFEAATEALGKIALRREVGEKQLQALGVNEQDFLATLSKSLGRSVEATKKAVQSGKLAAPTLLNAALATIADKQGGALGVAALAGGQTLGATIARLSALPDNMIKQLSETPAAEKLRTTLDGFVSTLSGPKGSAIMDRLASALDGFLAQVTPERMVAGFESLANAMLQILPAMVGLAEMLGRFVSTVGTDLRTKAATGSFFGATANAGGQLVDLSTERGRQIAEAAGLTVTDLYAPFLRKSGSEIDAIVAKAIEDGKLVGLGFATGISQSVGTVQESSAGMAQSSVDATSESLQIRSPSRIFEGLGARVAEGFALGMERGAPAILTAGEAMMMAPAGIGAGSAAGGIVVHWSGDVLVSGGGAGAREDARLGVFEALRQITAEVGA